jgi:hypothetical protein
MYQGLTLISEILGPVAYAVLTACKADLGGVLAAPRMLLAWISVNRTLAPLQQLFVLPGVRVGTLWQATWIMPNKGRGRRELYHEAQTAA